MHSDMAVQSRPSDDCECVTAAETNMFLPVCRSTQSLHSVLRYKESHIFCQNLLNFGIQMARDLVAYVHPRLREFSSFTRRSPNGPSTKFCHMFGSESHLKIKATIGVFLPRMGPITAYFRRFYDDIKTRISPERNSL